MEAGITGRTQKYGRGSVKTLKILPVMQNRIPCGGMRKNRKAGKGVLDKKRRNRHPCPNEKKISVEGTMKKN